MLVGHRGLSHHEAHGPRPTGFFVHVDEAGGIDKGVARIDHAGKGTRIAGIDARPAKTHLRGDDRLCPMPGDKRRWRNDVPITTRLSCVHIGVETVLDTYDVSVLQDHGTRHLLFEAAELLPQETPIPAWHASPSSLLEVRCPA